MMPELWRRFLEQDIKIVSDWSEHFKEGHHCPFTVHQAFLESLTWYLLVSGRNYHKARWLRRIANVLSTQTENLFFIDDKEEYDARLNKANGVMGRVSKELS